MFFANHWVEEVSTNLFEDNSPFTNYSNVIEPSNLVFFAWHVLTLDSSHIEDLYQSNFQMLWLNQKLLRRSPLCF